MNIIAELTLGALQERGAIPLPNYSEALISACQHAPPLFGSRDYGEIYREAAGDPAWMAMSLVQNAQGEGEGSGQLWNLAASTPDDRVATLVKGHAIDESRHAKAYVAMLRLTFPDVVDDEFHQELKLLSPGYTRNSPLEAEENSPYASAITLDDLIQMNIAEIRTLVHHILQRPMIRVLCAPERRHRLELLHDRLRSDEVLHIGYTADLIEEYAQQGGGKVVKELMHERMKDFNEITFEDLGQAIF